MNAGTTIELLDGDARLIESFLAHDEADALIECLMEGADWQHHEIRIHGRKVASPRLSAWYGDPGSRYRYSGVSLDPLPWLPVLATMKGRIERVTASRFNSVLLNLYRDGQDSMGWHSDDEPELGERPVIASLSLGAVRRFRLKHRFRREIEPVTLALMHGSLLVMRGRTQSCWKHQLPKTKRVDEPRVNLTYRWVTPR